MFSHFRGKVAWSNLAAILPETEETLSNFCPSKFFAGFQGPKRGKMNASFRTGDSVQRTDI